MKTEAKKYFQNDMNSFLFSEWKIFLIIGDEWEEDEKQILVVAPAFIKLFSELIGWS